MVTTYCDRPVFDFLPNKRKTFRIKKEIKNAVFYSREEPHFFRLCLELPNPYYTVDVETGEMLLGQYTADEIESIRRVKPKQDKKRADSIKRTQDKIHDLVMCNTWDYFFTGTLNGENFDPTNAKAALKPLQKWLDNAVQRHGLKYVLVAELQPKSGRIHFHGFINDVLEMVDSGTRLVPWSKKPVKLETIRRKGYNPDDYAERIVYNVPQWRFGYTTAIKAYNGSSGCARYITKYITKDSKAIFGRYYWSSRNLKREPTIVFENTDFDSVKTKAYSIPRIKQQFKYYTFFPGENEFFWEKSVENTSNILDILNDFETIEPYNDDLSDFEQI